jgi:histidine ammonia-lyase
MSKQIYQNKILLNIDNATMEMVREMEKKQKKINISRGIREAIKIAYKVIHS